MPVQSVTSDPPPVVPDPVGAAHLGDLTRIVSPDLVDAAVDSARATQRRLRQLPSRVVVYLLLAAVLFTDVGYRQVFARLVVGAGAAGPAPGSSALSQAIRRIGVAPLRELFDLVRTPAAGGARWRGLLVCAIDGTCMFTADTPANAAAFGRQTGRPDAPSGYPMLRLLTVVACGSRTVIDAVFGSYRVGETSYAPRLVRSLSTGMLVLGDRNFAVQAFGEQIAGTGACLLLRCKNDRRFDTVRVLPDGTELARWGRIEVRVIDAQITVTANDAEHLRTGRYRLVTTLTDHHAFPALEIVELYHQRWEIETGFREMKSTILDGRVLRARTPAGVEQEVYAVLIVHQALRTAIADTVLTAAGVAPDRLSYIIALTAARDSIHCHTQHSVHPSTDLIGRIGRAVLSAVLPRRRSRSSPRVVKRAISKHRAKGPIDRRNHNTHITTQLISSA